MNDSEPNLEGVETSSDPYGIIAVAKILGLNTEQDAFPLAKEIFDLLSAHDVPSPQSINNWLSNFNSPRRSSLSKFFDAAMEIVGEDEQKKTLLTNLKSTVLSNIFGLSEIEQFLSRGQLVVRHQLLGTICLSDQSDLDPLISTMKSLVAQSISGINDLTYKTRNDKNQRVDVSFNFEFRIK